MNASFLQNAFNIIICHSEKCRILISILFKMLIIHIFNFLKGALRMKVCNVANDISHELSLRSHTTYPENWSDVLKRYHRSFVRVRHRYVSFLTYVIACIRSHANGVFFNFLLGGIRRLCDKMQKSLKLREIEITFSTSIPWSRLESIQVLLRQTKLANFNSINFMSPIWLVDRNLYKYHFDSRKKRRTRFLYPRTLAWVLLLCTPELSCRFSYQIYFSAPEAMNKIIKSCSIIQ